MKISTNRLTLSEHFYSIQCEGKTTGVPAYFVRLSQCNLQCGCTKKFIHSLTKGEYFLEEGKGFIGDLHEQGKASWSCDTTPVWIKGQDMEYETLLESWKDQNILQDILDGIIHVIWTGGEPSIVNHQISIVNFLNYLDTCEDGKYYPNSLFSEIETNGTVPFLPELSTRIQQINCSAKLANSGMEYKYRIKPEAISTIMQHPNYQFKFVISTEEDIKELFDTYVNPFKIPLQNVVCMPGLDKQEDFHERTRFCLEMAKKYRFVGLTRLHISAWDQTTGV